MPSPPEYPPCPIDNCPHLAAMHDEDGRCCFDDCKCGKKYQVTFSAWYLANIALTLATHRQRRRKPWL